MDERQVRALVKGWYQRARFERDPMSKFVFLWFCFNAWLAYESDEDTDRRMITWLKSPQAGSSQLRASFDKAAGATTSLFPTYLRAMVQLSPIMSTGRRNNVVQITSPDDFDRIVEGIYQVRCNLFHGGQRVNDLRDQKLVRACARTLEKWIGTLVGSWGSIS